MNKDQQEFTYVISFTYSHFSVMKPSHEVQLFCTHPKSASVDSVNIQIVKSQLDCDTSHVVAITIIGKYEYVFDDGSKWDAENNCF